MAKWKTYSQIGRRGLRFINGRWVNVNFAEGSDSYYRMDRHAPRVRAMPPKGPVKLPSHFSTNDVILLQGVKPL